MAEAKFTPGPWIFHEQGDANDFCLLTEADHKWVIGFLQNGEFWTDTQRANARLVATAPELFGLGGLALGYMANELGSLLESHCLLDDKLQPIRDTLEEDVRESVEQIERDIAAARTILAKARGDHA